MEWLDSLLKDIDSAGDMPALYEKILDVLCAHRPHYNWSGFYFVDGTDLRLGAFRGPPTEHVRIPIGTGICGAAAAQNETIVVADVHADERYLSCFVSTRSEIVVPIRIGDRVLGEIDIDSDKPNAFGDEDRHILEAIAEHLAPHVS